jgi:hypothetical protein
VQHNGWWLAHKRLGDKTRKFGGNGVEIKNLKIKNLPNRNQYVFNRK